MRQSVYTTAALIGALFLSVPLTAAAEEAAGDGPTPLAAPGGYEDVAPAVRHYQQAQVYYEEGRYQEAAEELERARVLDPAALELLYNLALVYERLSEFDRAIAYLEQYLAFDLAAGEQDRVERMLSRLRGAREHMPDEPEPETRTRVVVRRYGLADGWFWGVLGAGLALGAVAVGTGATALSYGQEAQAFVIGQDGDRLEHDWLADTASGLAVTTDVFLGLAGAAAVTAILVYALRERPAEEREGSVRTDGWASPSDDWGPPPPSSTEDGAPEDGQGDGDGWGPPPPRSAAPPERPRPLAPFASAPRVALGPGAAMIAWEF